MSIAFGECFDRFMKKTACFSVLKNDDLVQAGVYPTYNKYE